MVQKYIFYLVISVTSDYNFVTTTIFCKKTIKHSIILHFLTQCNYWLHHITKQIAFLTNKALQYFYINEKYCRAFFIFLKKRADYANLFSRRSRIAAMKPAELTGLASTPSIRLTRSLVAIPSFKVSKQAASSWSPKFWRS